MLVFDKDINITICGEAGQGLNTIESYLVKILKLSGYNIFSTKEYMSRVRGGINSTTIRISDQNNQSYSDRIDILLILTKGAISHLGNRVNSNTLIFADFDMDPSLKELHNAYDVKLGKIALEVGNKIYANFVALGLILGLIQIDSNLAKSYVQNNFKKDDLIRQNNITSLQKGYDIGTNHFNKDLINFNIKPSQTVKDQLLISGVESLSLGFIAGGCNFISAYPMSPSTGVLTYLSKNAKEFNIVTEQAEDEISAVNMAIGAWYTGARAIANSSGGGFALMCEGISLAGIIESPLVVHIAQRPGPATGLPTRTEQADLNLALYSGHGEFARIVLAPGSIEECFYLAQKSFYLASKYQIPVFVLTDQYLLDSYSNIGDLKANAEYSKNHIIKTEKGYNRFKYTSSGLSDRGIPGYGEGYVVVDSDEHDESGHITESSVVREKMVNKRLKRYELIQDEIEPPTFFGPKDYDYLVVCFGSNLNIVKSAVSNLNNKRIAFIHLSYLWPLHKDISSYIKKAKRSIVVENNATSQLSKLIRQETGLEIDYKILKYDGSPFSEQELETKINSLIEKNPRHGSGLI